MAERKVAGLQPILDRAFTEGGFSEMASDNLRLAADGIGKFLFHRAGNLTMQLLPAAFEQAFVRRVPYQYVLEAVDRFRWLTEPEQKLGLFEPGDCILERRFVASGHLAYQGIGELAPDGCTNLADFLYGRETVESRHQGVLKGRWNGERGQGTAETIAVGIFYQNVSFKHRLCKLLDKQRVAIRLGDNLAHHLVRQRAAPGHLRDDAFNIAAIHATEL